MKIKQIYHIGLPCNDLERAVKFYTEVLGMKCTKIGYDTESGGPYKEKYGMFPNIARLFMEDGMCLVLFQRPAAVERGDFDEGTSHLALEVGSEDFDKAADELKKAGVKVSIDKPVVRPTGKAIYFYDTEQNYIQLWSRPKERPGNWGEPNSWDGLDGLCRQGRWRNSSRNAADTRAASSLESKPR